MVDLKFSMLVQIAFFTPRDNVFISVVQYNSFVSYTVIISQKAKYTFHCVDVATIEIHKIPAHVTSCL